MTTEAALGLIGGTMGLLTGFSILSGVEIIYFLIRFIKVLFPFPQFDLSRFFVSVRVPKAKREKDLRETEN